MEQELSSVGLYFADKPPAKAFTGIQLPPLFGVFEGLDIPAGAKEYSIADSFVLPVDVKAFGVAAHAHYLGKQMKLEATLPDGKAKTLLWIKDWDFSWQDQYQFKEFIPLHSAPDCRCRMLMWSVSSKYFTPAHRPPQADGLQSGWLVRIPAPPRTQAHR